MRISDWSSDVCSSDLILHIVAAQKPQNEAQAALAAQTAATHILTMKVAKRVADYPHDTRMIAAYAKLARASATQFETMAVLKGKRRSTRQKITERKSVVKGKSVSVRVNLGGRRIL